MSKRIWPKALFFGIMASSLLFVAYVLILTFLNSFAHAMQRFSELGLWMPAVIIGFGFQIFLFVYMREAAKWKNLAAGGSVAVSGGASAGSMALCCLHHVSDVIPIIGISAATVFLTRFEGFFLSIAVVSNVVGTIFMLGKIQEHRLFPANNRVLSSLFKLNMSKAFWGAVVLGTVALAVSLANSVYF